MTPLWTKAIEAADDARFLFRGQRYHGACNRAYFAMFNAARALLAEVHGLKIEKIKRHATVNRLFSLHLIQNGPFDKEFGTFLKRAGDARIVSDYDDFDISIYEAKTVIDAMERFMSLASSIMEREQEK